MKKVVLTLIALVAIAGLVFAAPPEFKATPSISGSATLTFGFDLDTGAFGISNGTSSNFKLELVPGGSDEKGGEGDVYGWIKVKDFGATLNSDNLVTTAFDIGQGNVDGDGTSGNTIVGNAITINDGDDKVVLLKNVINKPSIEAKLFLGPVYLNVLGGSDEINYATHGAGVAKGFNLITGDEVLDLGILGTFTTPKQSVVDVKNDLDTEHQGLIIGLKDTSVVDVQLGVASNYDWTDTQATINDSDNADSGWVIFAKVGLTLSPLSLSAGINLGTDTHTTTAASATDVNDNDAGDILGFGGKAELNIDLGGGMALKPAVAFDLVSVPENDTATTKAYTNWQLASGVRLAFPGSKLAKFGDIEPGFHAAFSMGNTGNATETSTATLDSMDLNFAFADGDVIPVLDVGLVFELTDLSNDSDWDVSIFNDDADGDMGFGVYAGASIDGGITPWVQATYKDINWIVDTINANDATSSVNQNDSFQLEVGVELKVVANTAFTLKYASGNLMNNFNYTKAAGVLEPSKSGVITFETKISY